MTATRLELPTVAHVEDALRRPPRRLRETPTRRAGVAMVLAGGATPEMLLIERAARPTDPWSGHLAFPGGRMEPGDRDDRDAARRETFEEVGLDLASTARYLGPLGEFSARPAGLGVAVHVFSVDTPPALRCDPLEVAHAFWVPLAHLSDPTHHVRYQHAAEHDTTRPAVRVLGDGRPVLWGFTYHVVEVLFDRLGAPLPPTGWLV